MSACRSSTARVPPSSTFCQSAPTSSDGSASTNRRGGSASFVADARCVICIGSCCSVNQYDAYGAERQEVRAVADARKLGQAEHLDRESGPAKAVRSSSAGCTVRDRLATTRIVSRSSRRR